MPISPFCSILCLVRKKVYRRLKILVFSDSHGDVASMDRTILREKPDHILHLGDCVRDAKALEKHGIPLTCVAGNCDWGSDEPTVLTTVFRNTKIYMTPGHLHRVKMQYQLIFYAGLEAEADIILFGHTHQAECFTKEGVWLMNPGACGPRGTYGVITLEKGGPECCIKSVQ